jgi:hypothetical protein
MKTLTLINLLKYSNTEKFVSLVVNDGLRNISEKGAKSLIYYYKENNPKLLAEIFKISIKYMVILGHDASQESIEESIRLFEFLSLVVIMHDFKYKLSDEIGYTLKQKQLGPDEYDKQLVELHFGVEPDTDDTIEDIIGE